IDAHYDLFDMPEGSVKTFLEELKEKNISGINITVPYKEIAYEFVKTNGVIDPYADKVGAINTIVVEDDSLYGYNTDGTGFMRSVFEDMGFDITDKKVVLIGAGGGAKACAVKIAKRCKKLSIIDLVTEKAEELALKLNNIYNTNIFFVCKTDEEKKHALEEAHFIVNATACGRDGKSFPFDEKLLRKNMCVYDLIYDPIMTPLLTAAQAKGCKVSNGLNMLLYQGAEAFTLWTQKQAPIEIMRKALLL
ncbi:MAG: hypothetical protein PHQ52_07905, partial [Candidatus Omnitrophica bacterium]|nr:hypothetical protein [Candidatus Omnitrophota bacterium]